MSDAKNKQRANKYKVIAAQKAQTKVNLTGEYNIDLIRSLAFLANEFDEKQKKLWAISYLKHHKIKAPMGASDGEYRQIGVLAYIHENIMPLNDEDLQKLDAAIEKLRARKEVVKVEEKEAKPIVLKESVYVRTAAIASDYKMLIDEHLDDIVFKKSTTSLDPKRFAAKYELKGNTCAHIARQLQPQLDELLLTKTDAFYKEAYSNLSTRQLTFIIKELTQIIEGLSSEAALKKAASTTRIRKPKPAGKQVEKVVLTPMYNEIKGVPAMQLIGAMQAWFFDIERRKLTVYESSSPNGFTVERKTLCDFDPAKSFTKTIRKPEITLPELLKATKRNTIKVFNEVKAVTTSPSGRMHEKLILVRVN